LLLELGGETEIGTSKQEGGDRGYFTVSLSSPKRDAGKVRGYLGDSASGKSRECDEAWNGLIWLGRGGWN